MQYVQQSLTEFTDSNITETYAEYNPSTTYVFEETSPTSASICRYGSYYYRSVVDGNTGFSPVLYDNVKWVKWGVANSHAMLDVSSLTKTVLAGDDIQVTFDITQTDDTVGIGNYEADTVFIELLDALNDTIWSYTVPTTLNNGVYDWYTWTYAAYEYETDKGIAVKFPPNTGTQMRITFNSYIDSTQTSCGFMVVGKAIDMGFTTDSVSWKFNSYALRKTDDFGTMTITKRSVQDVVDFTTVIDSSLFSTYKRKIKSVYNDIMLFIVDESETSEHENLITLGVIQDAHPILSNMDKTTITWSVIEAI